MIHSFLRRLIVAAISISLSPSLFAAAFQFYELGTPIIGTAGVGQAAVAMDASTSYFNPAGMALLPGSAFLLGSQMLLPYINFSQSPATTIAGDNGGSAGTLTPGLDFYYVYRYSPQLQLGISLTQPYAGLLTYNDGWAGRFYVQTLQLYALNLNPAISYKVNDWLALGGGVSVEYANLQETQALPLTRLIDGQVNLKTDNFSPGFNLGVMLMPSENTQIGIAFRSQILHHLRGRITFLRLAVTPSASTKLVMPANVIVSVVQNITNQFSLLGELGWSDWSSMHNTIVDVAGFTATTIRDWKNTYRVGVAGRYRFTPNFLVQAGASYDSSPTTSSHRLPDLPMDRQIRVGAGLIYNLIRAVDLGLSYEYMNMGNANINNTSSNGSLVGSYSRNYINVFQVSLNVNV